MPVFKYMERLICNTESIQKEFFNYYRDYFSKCLVVVSAPSSILFTGEYAVMYGGVAIGQKMPFRLYVGLEPITDKKNEFGFFEFLFLSQKRFEATQFDLQTQTKLLKLLNNYISGVRIHLISEFAIYCGLNLSGAFAAALALAILVYNKEISPENLELWSKYSIQEIKNKSETGFEKVHRLAWKIEAILRDDSASGAQTLIPLITSSYPIVYFTEKRTGDYNNHPDALMPCNVLGHYELFNNLDPA